MSDGDPRRRPARVLNATGDVFCPALGGAPLAPSLLEAVGTDGGAFAPDLDARVAALVGAQAACFVTSGSAATLLALAAMGKGRRVAVARGELVELADGARVAELVERSGALLEEVGAANAVRLDEYEAGQVLLKVACGFDSPSTGELAQLARRREGRLVVFEPGGAPERVRQALAAGADLVSFGCERHFGGPPAGVVAGRSDLIALVSRHSLAPVLALEPLRRAALSVAVECWASGRERELPAVRMARESLDAIGARAAALAAVLGEEAVVGHIDSPLGKEPGQPFASIGIVIRTSRSSEMAGRLRRGEPPVAVRVEPDAVILDARTLADRDVVPAARAVRQVLAAFARESNEGPLLRPVARAASAEGGEGSDVLTEA